MYILQQLVIGEHWIIDYIGGACRLRVLSRYKKQFSCPADAEKYYFGCQDEVEMMSPMTTENAVNSSDACTQTDACNTTPVDNDVGTCLQILRALPNEELLTIISSLFKDLANAKYGVQITSDYLYLSICATMHLNQSGRSNLLYGLAKAMGTMRSDGSDSRLPAKRMPTGLIAHIVAFFNADSYHKVRVMQL